MQKDVNAALEHIRAILQRDGGDIECVRITDDAIVQVRLTGRCTGCPKAGQTLQSVVARTILKMVPAVRRVEAVE